MKKRLQIKTAVLCAWMALNAGLARSQAYTEGFDDIGTLAASGWFTQNNSAPLGITGWFQGTNVPTGPFDSYSGAPNSYIGTNYNNTTGGNGTISNWLFTPNRTLRNGDVFQFYTRTSLGQTEYPDRLQVRMSTNGASTNVGSGATTVGDFTTLLLDINSDLVTGVYPKAWTQYTITISGLPAPTSGRIAFRYYVTNGGPLASSSDYIGIDDVAYQPYACPTISITPTTFTAGAAGTSYSSSLNQTGALGTPSFAITAGALPPGITLSAAGSVSGTPTATGTFNFTVTAADASGCAGSRAYSLVVVCPSNPLSFPAPAPLCSNDSPLILDTASPAGGTYSGTGVAAGQFDPAAGTQTVTYDYTDPYGCAHSTSQTVTVNTAPTVNLTAPAPLCSNAPLLALTGGTPAGGTYSGTGVTAGQFDPAAGTQTLTYTYTDANGCSDAASVTVTVNTAPTVELTAPTPLCSNAPSLALTGGTPAGGTYSGTGVTAGEFDPAAGTQTLTYTYTDANGCSDAASFTVTVNTAPTVELSALPALCSNAPAFALTAGTPAGGTYSGTGVTAGEFDPAAGTQTLTYTYTDSEGCSNSADATLTVNTAPTVELPALPALCSNAPAFALTGGSPAGGTYSGTGVTAGYFNPAAGTQTVTYTYTDSEGCSNSNDAILTVNTAPMVNLSTLPALCSNAPAFVLTAGTPAGGTYSGTGITDGQFDPAAGTQSVAYTYTDSLGCSSSAYATLTVNTAPTVTFTLPGTVCVYGTDVALGATPAGGTYTGTGITGTSFSPAVAGTGTHHLTYVYTDTHGCSDEAAEAIEVSACAGITEIPAVAVTAYPNPSTGQFTLSFTDAEPGMLLEVTDLQGKRIHAERIYASGTFTHTLDLTASPAGIYYLRMASGSRVAVQKLIRQ